MRAILLATAVHFAIGLTYSAAAQDFEQIRREFAAVKDSLTRNEAALRQYSWTAHTEISHRGKVKTSTTESCRYGPDGTVQTTSVGPRGALARAADAGSDAIQKYVRRAAALIRNYVSPSPDRLDALFESGDAYFGKADPDELRLHLRDYLKLGDSLVLDFDSGTKALRNIEVTTYLDDQRDEATTLRVAFQPLPDATNCVATTVLSTAAEEIQLKTQNEDYRKVAP